MYLLLLLLWFIFNGRVTLEVALFGIVICGWLYWFICKYMGYSFQREKVFVKKIPLYLKYAFVLLWEIFKANVDVIKIIFSPKKAEIQPALVRFHTDLKSEASLVALANSITLTPGHLYGGIGKRRICCAGAGSGKIRRGSGGFRFCKAVEKVGGMSV